MVNAVKSQTIVIPGVSEGPCLPLVVTQFTSVCGAQTEALKLIVRTTRNGSMVVCAPQTTVSC